MVKREENKDDDDLHRRPDALRKSKSDLKGTNNGDKESETGVLR